jgi:hypothetical protein
MLIKRVASVGREVIPAEDKSPLLHDPLEQLAKSVGALIGKDRRRSSRIGSGFRCLPEVTLHGGRAGHTFHLDEKQPFAPIPACHSLSAACGGHVFGSQSGGVARKTGKSYSQNQ